AVYRFLSPACRPCSLLQSFGKHPLVLNTCHETQSQLPLMCGCSNITACISPP
ncbi:unnamed protein product, partial [Mycena citricolor]